MTLRGGRLRFMARVLRKARQRERYYRRLDEALRSGLLREEFETYMKQYAPLDFKGGKR